MLKIDAHKWQKRVRNQLLIYFFLGLMLAFGGYGVMSATLTAPENPMTTQKADIDQNPDTLVNDGKEDDAVYIPLTVQSQNDSNSEELTKTDDGLSNEEPAQADRADDTKEQQKQNNSSSGSKGKSTSSSTGDNGTGGGENPNPSATTTEYFTTTIKDGEEVSSTTYSFGITQKNTSLTVKAVHVIVNGVEVAQFNDKVLLKEGPNTIVVKVDYVDVGVSPQKSYTVNVDTKNLIINTSLKDQTVTQSSFPFTAMAKYKDSAVDLTVTLNGKKITGSDGNYSVFLKAGDNQFVLTAKVDNLPRTESYTVTYTDDGNFKISTDLVDQTVNQDSISFTVWLENNDDGSGTPVAKLNDNKLTPTKNADGTYTYTAASLHTGANTIRITAKNNDGAATAVVRTVTFRRDPPGPQNRDPSGDKGPTLTTNLTNVTNVTSSNFLLTVLAKDYEKNRIYNNNITVTLNGATVLYSYENGTATTYLLNLAVGQNYVTIVPMDNDQNSIFRDFTFTYTPTNGVVGHVTISLEASTVGLGTLIEPVSVPFYNNECGSYILARFLEEYGYTYKNGSESMEDSFYLARIYKEGMAANYKIPQDLQDAIAAVNDDSPTGVYDPNSLGEHDFYQQSGWMYMVNGNYVGYSFSGYYPADGDVLRIRYTLALGRDIRGADASAAGSTNFDKEW